MFSGLDFSSQAAETRDLPAMKFGISLLLWTDDATGERHLPLCSRLKALGYDGVELPIHKTGATAEHRQLGARLSEMGLAATASSACPRDKNPASSDANIRRAATDFLRGILDNCAASGASILAGPMYAALGEFTGRGPTDDEIKWARDVIAEVAPHAKDVGVTIALEFLNRFETHLLNRAEDAAEFARSVNHPSVGVHYDTFHAHIEEKSQRDAIFSCADVLRYFHISENDRGVPGTGQIDFRSVMSALRKVEYNDWMVIEAFGQTLPKLVAATKIWRPLYESEDQLAEDGLRFMKRNWAILGQ